MRLYAAYTPLLQQDSSSLRRPALHRHLIRPIKVWGGRSFIRRKKARASISYNDSNQLDRGCKQLDPRVLSLPRCTSDCNTAASCGNVTRTIEPIVSLCVQVERETIILVHADIVSLPLFPSVFIIVRRLAKARLTSAFKPCIITLTTCIKPSTRFDPTQTSASHIVPSRRSSRLSLSLSNHAPACVSQIGFRIESLDRPHPFSPSFHHIAKWVDWSKLAVGTDQP